MGRKTPTDQELYDQIKEEVKARVKVWPSAYASGQLVSEYKREFADKYGADVSPYLEPKPEGIAGPLERWYKEKWVNVCERDAKGNFLPCGRKKASLKAENYPYCRPLYRITEATPRTATELSFTELQEMCKYKRSKPQGVKGKPTYVYQAKQLKKISKTIKQKGGAKKIGAKTFILRELKKDERAQSSKKFKKYAVDLPIGETVYFGHNKYSDYTLHKDPNRMENYLSRHRKRENWTLGGIDTAGFWSRWILWNKPSFKDSIQDIEKRFNINIINDTKRKT